MNAASRRTLLFVAWFIPVFLGLLWLYPRALPGYERLVLTLANPLLGGLATPVEVVAGDDGTLTAYQLGPRKERLGPIIQHYEPYVLFLSLALFPALLVATPAAPRRRLRWLAVGLPLLFVLHVVSTYGLFGTALCLARNPASHVCDWIKGLVLTSGQVGSVAGWALLTWSFWLAPRSIESGR